MGKIIGSGLFAVIAMWMAAAIVGAAVGLIAVILLALGCVIGVFVLFYQVAEKGDISKWPLMFIALLSPMAVMSIFGAISWNTEVAQNFTNWVYELEGFSSFIMLLFMYLGAYGIAVVAPTFGAYYGTWAIARENNNSVFVATTILSAAGGFLSGGWGHLVQASIS